MKVKHNKKRNTAFVYEALIREATAAILKKDITRRDTVVNLLKKHFVPGSVLYQNLECHRSLYESHSLDVVTSEKILREARLANRLIDPNHLFKAQSDLIYDINKELEPSVFNAFVPNYKTLASISQIFSHKISPRDQVLLEGEIISSMTNLEPDEDAFENIDNLVIKTFVEKFNKKYKTDLLDEQKELLSYYISSFADNALELKTFLNEEIIRLKDKLIEAKDSADIADDSTMAKKTDQIIERLTGYAICTIDDGILLTVLKTQSLVKEIYRDGSSN
jgi:hypothetical protein